ncbi:hypothetical protein RDABS01_009971 [Bienertia sinuspersici]
MEPLLDHYTCIIDALGRAGRLHEAEMLISRMPFSTPYILLVNIYSSMGRWEEVRAVRELMSDTNMGKDAVGSYSRTDRSKSSNYCLTIITVVIVSACLIWTWITMSSLAEYGENFSISVGLRKEFKSHNVNKKNYMQFEDNSCELLKDGLKGNAKQASGERVTENHLETKSYFKSLKNWVNWVKRRCEKKPILMMMKGLL